MPALFGDLGRGGNVEWLAAELVRSPLTAAIA
jgi:hypothetical protein